MNKVSAEVRNITTATRIQHKVVSFREQGEHPGTEYHHCDAQFNREMIMQFP